jgi:hypothetical protein
MLLCLLIAIIIIILTVIILLATGKYGKQLGLHQYKWIRSL